MTWFSNCAPIAKSCFGGAKWQNAKIDGAMSPEMHQDYLVKVDCFFSGF